MKKYREDIKMASSSEFVALVKKLQQYPNDSSLKKEVVALYRQLLSVSKENPMALYLAAHAYAPKSPQFQQTMRQAANMGCTNAMLVMCQILGKSNHSQDLKKAALYLAKIGSSDDSYVKEEAEKLKSEYPLLAQAQVPVQKQEQPPFENDRAHRFFMPKQRTEANSGHPLMQNTHKSRW